MYDNIGEKIKGLAKACFWVEAIASVITGIVIMGETEDVWCLAIILGGPLSAWVSSWLLYGFGEIIDQLCIIAHNTGKTGVAPAGGSSAATERAKIMNAFAKATHKSANSPQKRCPHCGEAVTSGTCEMCGKTNSLF